MSDGADWWQQQQLLEQEQWEKQERINNGNRHYDSWRIWHRKKHIITQLKSSQNRAVSANSCTGQAAQDTFI